MKSNVVVLIFLLILAITKTQCQIDEERSYFEIGERYEDGGGIASGYVKIEGKTDLRNNSDIELRYTALDSPASFIEMEVNAVVKTFKFIYLNESSCIIRFLGMKSSNPLVIATVKIHVPIYSENPKTGRFEHNFVNKTLVLKMVKEVTETTAMTNVRVHEYAEPKETNKAQFPQLDKYCATCGSSTITVSMILMCCVMLINFY